MRSVLTPERTKCHDKRPPLVYSRARGVGPANRPLRGEPMKTKGVSRAFGAAALGVLVLAVGCSEPAALDGTERTGVVRWYASAADLAGSDPVWPDADAVVIEAPGTVTAGESFEAVVWTVGNSGCWEVARTEVENGASLAEILPVDRDRMTEGIACTAVMVELDHRVELVLTTPGEATIRVVGRVVVGDDFQEGEEFVVERTVTVTQ